MSYFKIIILATSIGLSGCSLVKGKTAEDVVRAGSIADREAVAEENKKEEAKQTAKVEKKAKEFCDQTTEVECEVRDGKVYLLKEKEEVSKSKCMYSTTPEGALALGVIVGIQNPITILGSLAYVGGEYYYCVKDRQDLAVVIDISEAIEKARKMTSDDLKQVFEKAVAKINDKSASLDKSVEAMNQKVKDMTEEQKTKISEFGAMIIREIYSEIDQLRNSQIPVLEKE